MKDFTNTTFIIPVRIEHPDRARNAITVLSYLLNKFDTKIIVKEVDRISNFNGMVMPYLKQFCSEDRLKQLVHVFEQSDDPVFYRMKIINEMIDMCDTKVVVNYDIDVLLQPQAIFESVFKIVYEKADLVYPYNVPNFACNIYADANRCRDFIVNDYNFDIITRDSRIDTSYAGHVQFFNRLSWIEGGMENENFRGSAPEDWERLERFVKMGYKVERLNHYAYHIEHHRGNNSYPVSITGNPYYQANQDLYNYLNSLSGEELKEYYSKQEYLKKYKGKEDVS